MSIGETYRIIKKSSESCSRPNKKPKLSQTNTIYEGFLKIQEQQFKVEKVAQGSFHYIYSFPSGGSLKGAGEKIIDLSNVILRTANPQMSIKRAEKDGKGQCVNNKEAYQYLIENQIPVPNLFLVIDNNMADYWILEKCLPITQTWTGVNAKKSYDELSEEDKKALQFVQYWISRSVEMEKELINDFYPRNIMKNTKGEIVVTDFSLPGKKWEKKAGDYLHAWSLDNDEVFEFLIKEMPEKNKVFFRSHREDKQSLTQKMSVPF